MTPPETFEAVVAEVLDPLLQPRGFVRQPVVQVGPGWWVRYTTPVTELVVNYEVGSTPWLTLGLRQQREWNVHRIAKAHAARDGQELDPEPLGDLRAILQYYASLLSHYCTAELAGQFEQRAIDRFDENVTRRP